MFDGNWMLFILILLIVFGGNGGIAGTELAVLIAAVGAIVLAENGGLGGLCGCQTGCNNCGQS